MTEDALLAVLFTALGKFGEKEGRRELLKAGSYQVLIRMSGDVNDTGFNGVKLAGTLSVGEDGVQPGSVAMPPDQIVGYFLGMLRPKAREQILRTLPDAVRNPGSFRTSIRSGSKRPRACSRGCGRGSTGRSAARSRSRSRN
jgi:hypothetical protein